MPRKTTVNKRETSPSQSDLRHDWQSEEVLALMRLPLTELIHRAQSLHRQYHPENTVQLASLLSIKTGACPEDCKYCPQSAHYSKDTGLGREKLMDVEVVLSKAHQAKEAGASRFCMGAAWREVRDGPEFDAVLEMVRGVRSLGMEACVTLGMLNDEQAERLAEAGLTAYNHNLDTSPEFYGEIITTRTYQDRLDTLARVRKTGVTLCSGGIIGMGESEFDRARMLQVLANLEPHPESVPINALVPVAGTPLAKREPVDPIDMVRMVATARVVMPASRVRLSAGRHDFSREAQILCLLAGAKFDFLRRKTADHGEQRHARGSGDDPRGGPRGRGHGNQIPGRKNRLIPFPRPSRRHSGPIVMSEPRTVYVNGEYLAETEAKVSIFDRAFLFADGVYEVTAVIDGRLVDFDSHLARLARSLGELGLKSSASDNELRAMHEELIARNGLREGLVYMQISRGAADREFAYPEGIQPTLIAFTQAKQIVETQLTETGVKVVTLPDIRWQRRDIKSTSLLAQAMAKEAAKQQGAFEGWMVEDGFVTEGTSSTSFIVTSDGTVVTRPLSTAILPGVTRRALIALAKRDGIALEERPFTVAEAHKAQEAFLSSASTVVLPVVEIDGVPIGDGRPGPIARQFRALYLKEARKA